MMEMGIGKQHILNILKYIEYIGIFRCFLFFLDVFWHQANVDENEIAAEYV